VKKYLKSPFFYIFIFITGYVITQSGIVDLFYIFPKQYKAEKIKVAVYRIEKQDELKIIIDVGSFCYNNKKIAPSAYYSFTEDGLSIRNIHYSAIPAGRYMCDYAEPYEFETTFPLIKLIQSTTRHQHVAFYMKEKPSIIDLEYLPDKNQIVVWNRDTDNIWLLGKGFGPTLSTLIKL